MTLKEKILYHQIHPLKLSVDFSTSFATTYLAWQHDIPWFLALFLLPSVIITLLLIKFADLQQLKNSSLGKYIAKYMTRKIEGIRLVGQITMWVAAWFHAPFFIVAGFLIIVGGWLNGLLFKKI